MSVITYAGEPCLPPERVRDHCARHVLPADWYGLPNGYENVLGAESGRGRILLSRASLDIAIDAGEEDLVLSADSAQQGGQALPPASVTLKDLHVTRARCLTPGLRGDESATYLVELADRRALAAFRVIDRGYNVRTPSGSGAYDAPTLNAGVNWTWNLMVQDIWVACDFLGAYPGLPYTPAGEPLNACFYGSSAVMALGATLAELNLSLRLDLETTTFSIVDLADAGAADEALLAANEGIRVYDDDEVLPVYGRVPAKVSVRFRSTPTAATWAGDPFYLVLVPDPNGAATRADADAVVVLDDDLTAYYDSAGSLQNGAALTARAGERAAAYFAQIRADRFRRVYGLPLTGVRPGPRIRSVFHGDRGRGVVTRDGGLLTEVVRMPDTPWRGTRAGMPPAQPVVAITVEATDGTPSYSGISTVQVTETDGYVLTNPVAGTARLAFADAGVSQKGAVNTTTQSFAGHKTLTNKWTIEGDAGSPNKTIELGGAGINYMYTAATIVPSRIVGVVASDGTYEARSLLTQLGTGAATWYFNTEAVGSPLVRGLVNTGSTVGTPVAGWASLYVESGTYGCWLYSGTGSTDKPVYSVIVAGVAISGKYGTTTTGDTISGGLVTGIGTGTVPVGKGGTGVTGTPANGQLLIGNGTGFTLATLAAGANISVTNGAGSITIAATGVATVSFATIAVSGQSDVVADSTADTLTLVAGPGIVITTDAGADEITIATSGGGPSTGTVAATGSTQGGAAALAYWNNIVTGADGTKGVILDPTLSKIQAVYNSSGLNTLKVYPNSGKKISGGAVDAAQSLSGGQKKAYWYFDDVWWYVDLT